jgi:hypothetical protein
MTLPQLLRTIRGMVRDTFRQSLASKLFWGMLAMTLLATLLCASIDVRGDIAKTNVPGDTGAFISKAEAERIGL